MSTCTAHAVSSAHRFGGEPEDYVELHKWFDEPKGHIGDWRQRALRHHTLGIVEAIEKFGDWLTLSTGRRVSTRLVCEQHMMEDFGRLPSVQDWLQHLDPQPWMANAAQKLPAVH
jgi:hypothetical protein